MSKALDPIVTPETESMAVCHPLFLTAPSSVTFKKVRKRLLRQMQAAMDDFGMVQEGQKWLVCLSGGKDSYTLLSLLLDLKSRGVLPVELLA
ncbi:MAG: tRNA 2-thiocytidine(32) synthetase TtcA, partial [Kangiellaceae bacterium]